MSRLGDGYGSEWNLRWYHAHAAAALDSAVGEASAGAVEWLYPPSADVAEPTSADLLAEHYPTLVGDWEGWWPKVKRQQTWDAVATATQAEDRALILIEAKGNHPEFVGGPCGATNPANRDRIATSLGEVKQALGVHPNFSWLGSYYQYANRLAFLWFLRERGVAVELLYLYFVGDVMRHGQYCPTSEQEWGKLAEARRLTLGLPTEHAFFAHVHHAFLPAFNALPAAGTSHVRA